MDRSSEKARAPLLSPPPWQSLLGRRGLQEERRRGELIEAGGDASLASGPPALLSSAAVGRPRLPQNWQQESKKLDKVNASNTLARSSLKLSKNVLKTSAGKEQEKRQHAIVAMFFID